MTTAGGADSLLDPGGASDCTTPLHEEYELRRLVEAGKLRPQIQSVLPLEEASEALERVAGRHTRGKIVLEIG
jgi:NADPH:quinone reductase-like Zn-dependent oxidoreductase